MRSAKSPWWQQATALVTVSTGGVITGFNFVPGAAATMTSPNSVPVHLLALEQAARPDVPGELAAGGDSAGRVTSDAQLRAAIVNVAGYYLRLAKTKTPAQVEALIWGRTSSDGADHGPSCAAFASLTLELAAQTTGLRSWVAGGTTYPWPMPEWADVRVETNPGSPDITSMQADASAHGRWHPLGDGYQPQPGDWALYDGHVEVVTGYAGGVLDTIGADSLPNLTVNAHSSAAPLAEQGVLGFIDNGHLEAAAGSPGEPGPAGRQHTPSGSPGNVKASAGARPAAAKPGKKPPGAAHAAAPKPAGSSAAVPGLPGTSALSGSGGIPGTAGAGGKGAARAETAAAAIPGLRAGSTAGTLDAPGTAVIPGAHAAGLRSAEPAAPARRRAAHAATPHKVKPAHAAKPAAPPTPAPSSSTGSSSSGSSAHGQQAFISLVAPGAVAAQHRYGVPAAVTIAQAIEESAWGQSGLAARYHNLFGIKGTGPAGSVSLPTSEYQDGHWVKVEAQFRVYHNDAESIADHAELLATSGYYTRAMADRGVPDAFANALTGVYATDPHYGANLIALMKLYNLYQYGATSQPAPAHTAAPAHAPAGVPTAPAGPTPRAGHGAKGSPSAAANGHHGGSHAGRAVTGTAAVPGVAHPGRLGAAAPAAAAGQATAPARVAPVKRPSARQAPANGSRTGRGGASVPGAAAPGQGAGRAAQGSIPGVRLSSTSNAAAAPARQGSTRPVNVVTAASLTSERASTEQAAIGHVTPAHATAARASTGAAWYEAQLPHTVATALFASAKGPLARGEHLYRDVAAGTNVSWKLLAAVDWMQCKADPRYSPVQGEKLGARNDDGTSYSTKSAALTQCACDLRELAGAVYGIDLTARRPLSVRELAAAFAAFRWGAILWRHGVSPMEFPYSVAGLTAQHQKMHWPSIDAPDAPDRPGARFREPFGAVPLVLSLGYPATV